MKHIFTVPNPFTFFDYSGVRLLLGLPEKGETNRKTSLIYYTVNDIQEANEILIQKDSIVNQAQLEAKRIKDAAEQEAERTKEAAQLEAEAVIAAAMREHDIKVDESEIVKTAQIKAEETRVQSEQQAEEVTQTAQRSAYQIIDEAEARAANRRDGSDQYAKETLYDLEERLSAQLGQVRRGIDALGTDTDTATPVSVPSLNGAG